MGCLRELCAVSRPVLGLIGNKMKAATPDVYLCEWLDMSTSLSLSLSLSLSRSLYTQTHKYKISLCVHVYMCTCMHACKHMCTYVYMYTAIPMYVCECTCVLCYASTKPRAARHPPASPWLIFQARVRQE